MHSTEIDKVIRKLRRTLNKPAPRNAYWKPAFIVPRCERILSKRYRGYGRPRKSDYDYIEIDWPKRIKDLKKQHHNENIRN